jgi:NAD+ diphosphatase
MALSFFVNTFAGNPLDRRSDLRVEPDRLAELRSSPDCRVVAFWNGQPMVRDREGGLELADIDAGIGFDLVPAEQALFLGLDGEASVWAIELGGDADPVSGPLQGRGKFMDLRFAGGQMTAHGAGVAATAKALFEWRRRHGFCAACGQPSVQADAGWKRICPSCKAEHFPRTDPVTIMLPAFGEECLLGRQAAWPKGRFSTLAGFLEPGESIEAGCAREVMEEAGLEVVSVRYHSSQPWPFPTNLMIGLIAEVSSRDARPDQTELEEVRWFKKDELRALLSGDTSGWGDIEGFGVPPPFAIAHQLMKAWTEAGP